MARNLFKKRLIWGMLIAIGMVIAIVGSTLGSSALVATATTKFPYTVKDLGTLGGNSSYAYSINNAGAVVGYSKTKSGGLHAVLWSKSYKIDLGTLSSFSLSIAQSINDAGKVVGYSITSSGDYHAVLWDKGNKIDLGTLGGKSSYAYGINNADQIVGHSNSSSGYQAVLWNKGYKINLGTLGGKNSNAVDINDAGKVVGSSFTSSGDYHAALWENSNKMDLGTLGGKESFAHSINNAGTVVGKSDINSDVYHAVLWEKGNKKDLGTLGTLGTVAGSLTKSSALGINNAGKVVGFSDTDNGGRYAVLWDKGSIKNLNNLIPPKSGWLLSSAQDINDKGQIVAEGYINKNERVFLLTPVK